MIPFERQQRILQYLKQNKVASIVELASSLDVSHMTIRRDVQKLEDDGLLVQVSGGVRALSKINTEPSHSDKELLYAEEKKNIGKYASTLVHSGNCIYLDAGTTSLALCEFIKDIENITIVTNDFEVVNFLIEHSNSQIIHTGGVIRNKNCSSVGHLAANTLNSLNIDIAFISASSWDYKSVTTPDPDKVIVKNAAINVSTKKVLISDSSKYSQIATFSVFPITVFDLIITDKKLDKEALLLLQNKGLEVVLV